MKSVLRSVSLLLTVLLLSLSVSAQTATVTITLSPPAPAAFTVPVSQQVTLANGLTYTVTGTLTVTPTGAGPVPPPPAASTITRIADASGAVLSTVAAGGTLVVSGSGFGTFGSATVAGLAATVVSWTPTTVTLKAPVAGAAAGTAAGPVVLKPGDAPQATSAATVTITGLTAELPPPTGPTWESPVIAVSQTLPDPPIQPNDPPDYVPVPEPPLDLGEPSPVVFAVLDDDHVPVPPPYDLGQPLHIAGNWFGSQAGTVEINAQAAEILNWSATEITARSVQDGTPNWLVLLVKTADALYYQGTLGEVPYSTD